MLRSEMGLNQKVNFYETIHLRLMGRKQQNILGKRFVSGDEAVVVSDRKKLNNQDSDTPTQSSNPWSNKDLLPEEELALCQKELNKIKKKT